MPPKATRLRALRTVVGLATGLSLSLLLSSGRPASDARTPDIVQPTSLKQRLLQQAPREPRHEATSLLADGRGVRRAGVDDPAPRRVVLKLDAGVDDRAIAVMAQTVEAIRVRGLPHADFLVVDLPYDVDAADAARLLRGRPGVIYAEADGRIYPQFTPNDPLYRYQWNLQKIGMERTWDVNRGGATALVVAVVDSGVAYLTSGATVQAPELAGVRFVAPHDFIWNDDEPVDLDGHGTHVTGTIAQSTNNSVGVAGIAFNVSIMPIKAISGEIDFLLGAPNVGTTSIVAQAIRYAADGGAKVINLSLGGPVPSTAMRDALQYAVDRGAFIVIAAGNSGLEGNPPDYPAAYAKDIDGVMAVAALDYNMRRAYYSTSADYVEIAAPGGDDRVDLNNDGFVDGIVQQTLDPDAIAHGVFDQFAYLFEVGTSTATPHVAALGALLMDQGVTNPRAVEAAIRKFAIDVAPPGRDNDTGYGIIDPRATIRGLGLRR
jgi:serine protease